MERKIKTGLAHISLRKKIRMDSLAQCLTVLMHTQCGKRLILMVFLGYGSGAQPFYSDPQSGGLQGTTYGPGGYFTSAGPINPTFFPQPMFPVF